MDLLRQACKYNLRHDHEIGYLVDKHIQTRADLAAILNTLPLENLLNLTADAFGKAETISIKDLKKWVIEAQSHVEKIHLTKYNNYFLLRDAIY
jgi:hypothetical protein